MQRVETELPEKFPEAVIAAQKFIMGPGEARNEFKRHVENSPLARRIVGVETADKMTDPQIAARVRKQFLKETHAAKA